MESSKNMHTKQSQFSILVDFMCAHPDLAKGQLKTADAKQKSNQLWKRLADDLNAEGPPIREPVAWKKVWADHKVYIKSKVRKNQQSISGTGGGPSKFCSFTPTEELVVNLLHINEAVSGIPGAQVFGVSEANENLPNSQTPIEEESSQTDSLIPELHSTQIRSRPQKKENLLQKQVENQIEFQKNTQRALKEINSNLKNIAKYQKRKSDLSEKKFKLEKEKFDHKRKNDYERNKLKLAKLELKKEMLKIQSIDF